MKGDKDLGEEMNSTIENGTKVRLTQLGDLKG